MAMKRKGKQARVEGTESESSKDNSGGEKSDSGGKKAIAEKKQNQHVNLEKSASKSQNNASSSSHVVTSPKQKPLRLIDTYAAQCEKCYKWRSIESLAEYEEIRSAAPQKSFECKNDCEEPGDVDLDCDSATVWFMDNTHGLPVTPQGMKRILVPRENHKKVDVYYVTPKGKKLRSCTEVATFIRDNESFKGTQIEDVSFVAPKPMKKKTSS